MLLYLVLAGQFCAAAVVIFFLKLKLNDLLVDSAVRHYEFSLQQEQISGVKVVLVVSHKPLKSFYEQRLRKLTLQYLGPAATVTVGLDPHLWGGVIVKAGSKTIDCSLRQRLAQAVGRG